MTSSTPLRRTRALQDRLVQLLGSSVEGRSALVVGMLQRNANEVTSYWLQLSVSIGIATLGLVVGSTAVIIGAMLVAPLMGPIVALAMGLATGSPFLVLRSVGRIVFSVVVAIGGAALITALIPFHELNAEITARTSPTVLDLITAGFCALAGVYASLRPGSDTATTAAGTSIGISLVPPLCASGYGLGIAAWPVAGGAALLFLTNLVAIIVVGTLAFMAAGFNRVDTMALERDELAKQQQTPNTAAIARRLSGLFESRSGPALRILMPLLLLAAVYVPLRRALDEVAWQVRVRAAVRDALVREPHQIVDSRVRVEHHEVELRVVLLGTTPDAESARARLDAEVRAAAGVVPHIEVIAIPDATAFSGLKSTFTGLELALRTPPAPEPAPPPTPEVAAPSPAEQRASVLATIRAAVADLWPAGAVGEPLVIDVGTDSVGPLRITVSHLGESLGSDGLESLGRGLRAVLHHEVEVVDVAIPPGVLTRGDGDLELVERVAAAIRASAVMSDVGVCVVEPRPTPPRRRVDPRDRELAEALHHVLGTHPRVTTELGDDWSIRFVRGACPPGAAATAGSGAREAAPSRRRGAGR